MPQLQQNYKTLLDYVLYIQISPFSYLLSDYKFYVFCIPLKQELKVLQVIGNMKGNSIFLSPLKDIQEWKTFEEQVPPFIG